MPGQAFVVSATRTDGRWLCRHRFCRRRRRRGRRRSASRCRRLRLLRSSCNTNARNKFEKNPFDLQKKNAVCMWCGNLLQKGPNFVKRIVEMLNRGQVSLVPGIGNLCQPFHGAIHIDISNTIFMHFCRTRIESCCCLLQCEMGFFPSLQSRISLQTLGPYRQTEACINFSSRN